MCYLCHGQLFFISKQNKLDLYEVCCEITKLIFSNFFGTFSHEKSFSSKSFTNEYLRAIFS